MEVTVNGQPHIIADHLTIAKLVEHLGIEGPVAVEVNREIVPRAQHARRELASGDVVELVHFVGGG